MTGDVRIPPRAMPLCPRCDVELTLDEQRCPRCNSRGLSIAERLDPLIGKVVDERFAVQSVLGRGGMGTVYKAWQRSVGREVALKLIHAHFLNDRMAVRRFLREVKLASSISHPAVVNVFDFGQCEDGSLFLVMELVRGRTLSDHLRTGGGLDLPVAIAIGLQLCDALEAAHQASIVHRDLKPSNIMLAGVAKPWDRIKVLDFGLAKSLDIDESQCTLAGALLGTPRYMAPELVRGGTATPGTDLYALGVVLAEMALGRPLTGETALEPLLRRKLAGVPIDGVAAPLRPLVAKLIAPEPAARPRTVAEVRDYLRTLDAIPVSIFAELSGEPTVPMPVRDELSVAVIEVLEDPSAVPCEMLVPPGAAAVSSPPVSAGGNLPTSPAGQLLASAGGSPAGSPGNPGSSTGDPVISAVSNPPGTSLSGSSFHEVRPAPVGAVQTAQHTPVRPKRVSFAIGLVAAVGALVAAVATMSPRTRVARPASHATPTATPAVAPVVRTIPTAVPAGPSGPVNAAFARGRPGACLGADDGDPPTTGSVSAAADQRALRRQRRRHRGDKPEQRVAPSAPAAASTTIAPPTHEGASAKRPLPF